MFNKKSIISLFLLSFVFAAPCYSKNGDAQIKLKPVKTYKIKNPPAIGEGFYLGGFSDLYYSKGHLFAITDRGPNTDMINVENRDIRNFPLEASYKPFLIEFNLVKNRAEIQKIRNFENSGIPISEEKDCCPLDKNDKDIPFDINGVDSEALIIDKNGNFWVGDEYHPSIIQYNENLKQINRFAPEGSKYISDKITYNLPKEFINVRKNLGFESMTYDGNSYIYAFTQGNLKNSNTAKVIKFNIDTKKAETVYDYDLGDNKKNIISAAVFISPEEILTAERRNGEHQIRLLTLKENQVNKSELIISLKGINKINENHKIEGIAFDGKESVYIINDNDFGIDDKNRKDSFIIKFAVIKK